MPFVCSLFKQSRGHFEKRIEERIAQLSVPWYGRPRICDFPQNPPHGPATDTRKDSKNPQLLSSG